MEHQQTGQSITQFLPSKGKFALHLALLALAAFLLGPLLGPVLINWVNPTQAWGVATVSGDYSLGNLLMWGLAFLMIEAFFYIGWLISLARRGWNEQNQPTWYR